jgi:hypothetical protein
MSEQDEHGQSADPGVTPETEVFESDPNADSADGLAGGMGVSSEWRGTVRGGDEEVTYTAAPTFPDAEEVGAPTGADTPPEQTAHDGEPEVQPDNDVEKHPFDPSRNPRHASG